MLSKIFVSIAFWVLASSAASFDTTTMKAGFFYDSTTTILILDANVDCSAAGKPCILQVYDGSGPGASISIYSIPSDTIKVAYNFPRAALTSPRLNVGFYFYDGAGKIKAMAESKMGFKDPTPTGLNSASRGRSRAYPASLARFRIDGRVKP